MPWDVRTSVVKSENTSFALTDVPCQGTLTSGESITQWLVSRLTDLDSTASLHSKKTHFLVLSNSF